MQVTTNERISDVLNTTESFAYQQRDYYIGKLRSNADDPLGPRYAKMIDYYDGQLQLISSLRARLGIA